MRLPLEKKLKRAIHREIADGQDLMVDAIYEHLPKAVIHGGTAIWRCYSGSRFSEDIDIYLPPDTKKEAIDAFREDLEKNGFSKKKFKVTKNSIFSRFLFGRAEMRFEAVFKNVTGEVKLFEMLNGTYVSVYTLSAEELIKEKVVAYKSRKKVRDLYDVWFLLNMVSDVNSLKTVFKDVGNWPQRPPDCRMLKTIIILGNIPTVSGMLEDVKRWAARNT